MTETLAPYGQPSRVRIDLVEGSALLAGLTKVGPDSAEPEVLVGDGTGITALVDAHLDNQADLAKRLGLHGEATSGEIIVAAYRRWGRSLFEHISGRFAFAIVDADKGGVLLGRDHAGSRFLAYHQRTGLVAFATTSLALTGFEGVGHELDKQRFAEALIAGHGTDRTFVAGVRSVKPGNAIWFDRSGSTKWRWWLTDPPPIEDLGSVEAHGALLRSRLEGAVASALDGAKQPGAMLSGGLDSTSVVAVAATQLGDRPITTYTSAPPEKWAGPVTERGEADERFAVLALADQHPSLRPRFLDTRDQPLFEHTEMLWELGAGPARNPLNLLWFHRIVQDACVDGVDIMLTGNAGNFGFSADGQRWLVELARRGRFLSVAKETRSWARATPNATTWSVFRGFVLWKLLPRAWRRQRATKKGVDPISEYLTWSAIRPDVLAELDLEETLGIIDNTEGWTRDVLRMFDIGAAQAETDGAYRALYGVELRDPTANKALIETALRQPEWWRRHDGRNRAICREAMRDVLPPEIVDRRTIGIQLPDWLDLMTAGRDQFVDEIQEIKDHPASREMIDVPRLEALLASWPDRDSMADDDTMADYRGSMARAIYLSRYVRWFEARGRRIAAGGPRVILEIPD